MMKQLKLNIHTTRLEPLRVVFLKCTFRDHHKDHAHRIRHTFQFLREWAVCMGLNPEDLMQVGIPMMAGDQLIAYTCCLEYPLPRIDEAASVNLGQLPGGHYAITKLELQADQFDLRTWQLMLDSLHDQQLVQDHRRPLYEIFHSYSLDYCVPLSE